MGKGENAGNQHFLLFLKMFTTLSKDINHHLSNIKICLLQMLSNLVKAKNVSFGKELNLYQMPKRRGLVEIIRISK